MRAFSGLVTSTRVYALLTAGSIPRDIDWNSGPWALRTGYRSGLTREQLDAMECGIWAVREWLGGTVWLRIREIEGR